MLKQHKNQFIPAIQELGLDPAQFSAQELNQEGETIFEIKLRESQLLFQAKTTGGSFYHFQYRRATFRPGYPMSGWSSLVVEFPKVIEAFKLWIKNEVQKFIDEMILPDLWATIQYDQGLLTDSTLDEHSQSKFSGEEIQQIRLAIQEFHGLITNTFQASQEEAHLIKDRLDYLSKAADRLNRFDWKGIALSTLISISITLSLDTNQGKLLYHLFQQAFQHVLHLLQ
jgi:hypothetical protein